MIECNGGTSNGAIAEGRQYEPYNASQMADLDAARQEVAELTHALALAERTLAQKDLRERTLRHELQHRVRNTLAVVRSIFGRTADAYEAGNDIADHFKGRLDALARSQTWTGQRHANALELETLILDELLAGLATSDPRVSIRGPAVFLEGKTGEALALAMHELVTNSIKFGVLSHGDSSGSILIEWSVLAQQLTLAWKETGVSILAPAPLRFGFGRDFIENSLPYQVDAVTSFTLEPGAISCRIELPLADHQAGSPASYDGETI